MDEPLVLEAGDALAQPTRARLFALLDELRRPVATGELAERLALHPNGVRVHLDRLEAAGLVRRTRSRRRRGRPADLWMIAPDAKPGGRAPQGYKELGRWLARALASPEPGIAGIEQTGREVGRELAPGGPGNMPQALDSAFSALGFQPRVRERGELELSVCLGNCPYRDAVRENQPAICALHKGITTGLLDRIAPRAHLTAFIPRDPDEGGCAIEIRVQAG